MTPFPAIPSSADNETYRILVLQAIQAYLTQTGSPYQLRIPAALDNYTYHQLVLQGLAQLYVTLGNLHPVWGNITGTLSNQTDLYTALNSKAPTDSPTFTGTITLPNGAYVDGDGNSAFNTVNFLSQYGGNASITTANTGGLYFLTGSGRSAILDTSNGFTIPSADFSTNLIGLNYDGSSYFASGLTQVHTDGTVWVNGVQLTTTSDVSSYISSITNTNNGIAGLDSAGKIAVAQLPAGVFEYKGTWNPATNQPPLADNTGTAGYIYQCSIGGTVNLGSGNLTFQQNDWAIHNGTMWEVSPGNDGIYSIAGLTGAIISANALKTALAYTVSDVSGAAPLASPAFTGTPTAPTPATGDNSTNIATTSYVLTALANPAYSQTLGLTVRNLTGSAITPGQVVYVNGSQSGTNLTVSLAQGDSDAHSSNTVGVATTTIANNSYGTVITQGVLTGISTSTLTEGAPIYLSPTVAGGMTSTKPVAPNHMVQIGFCVSQSVGSATNGKIFVMIQNGYELDELHDVLITSVADGDFLQRSSGLWKNIPFATAVLGGVLTGLSTATSTAITATDTVLAAFGKLQAQITTLASAGYITLSSALTGLSTSTNSPITSTDSVVTAFGKLQAQITSGSGAASTDVQDVWSNSGF